MPSSATLTFLLFPPSCLLTFCSSLIPSPADYRELSQVWLMAFPWHTLWQLVLRDFAQEPKPGQRKDSLFLASSLTIALGWSPFSWAISKTLEGHTLTHLP